MGLNEDAALLLKVKAEGDWRPFWCAKPECDGRSHGAWDWPHARADQRLLPGHWLAEVVLSGRGSGKTRMGVETVLTYAYAFPGIRIAIVAPTSADISGVIVQGESGFLAQAPPWFAPVWKQNHRTLEWPNGSRAGLFSAEEPDRLRGPQHHLAWLDEAAAYPKPAETWTNLLLGLRLGEHPRALVTTTPRRSLWLRDLVADPSTVTVTVSTYANAANLPAAYLAQIRERFEGTSLGRQELHGELLADVDGALWSSAIIDHVAAAPELSRIVVAVDPAMTDRRTSDETGIVVAGLGVDGHLYVLDDVSGRYSPDGWAQATVRAFHHHQADLVVVEANIGGDLVTTNLTAIGFEQRHIKDVRAVHGKVPRAEAAVSLYERHKVRHVGYFAELEGQMTSWTGGRSPDRIDALVWALAELDRPKVGAATIASPVGLAARAPVPSWMPAGRVLGPLGGRLFDR